MDGTPVGNRHPLSEVGFRLGLIAKSLFNFRFNLWRPFFKNVQSPEVVVDLLHLGETHESCGRIFIGDGPGESELGLTAAHFVSNSLNGFKHSDSFLLLAFSEEFLVNTT